MLQRKNIYILEVDRQCPYGTNFYFCNNFVKPNFFKPQLAIARLRLHTSELSICLSVYPFVRLSVCRQNAKTRFSQKLSNLELWCLFTTYSLTGLFKEPIIGSLQSKVAEIHHLENRYDVIFFCRGCDLDKILQTGRLQNDVDCGDVWKWKP